MRMLDLLLVVLLIGIVPYKDSAYSQSVYDPYQSKSHDLNATANLDKVLVPIIEAIEKRSGRHIERPLSNDFKIWLKSDQKWFDDLVSRYRDQVPEVQWSMDAPVGRMQLPKVIANNGDGFMSGMDSGWEVGLLAENEASAVSMISYAWLWELAFAVNPQHAFELLASRSNVSSVTTADILDLQVALGYWPGSILETAPSKEVWKRLHESPNPVYRLIALEKFDSVPQSPSDLLALYRECLFGACSYLEVRALEAITKKHDFRPEVLALLEEYVASNPVKDDGTLPKLRNNFPNVAQGAMAVIATIRDQTQTEATPKRSDADPFARSANPTQAKKSNAPKPATPDAPYEPTSQRTLVWLLMVIVGMVVAVWVFLRKSK